MELIQPPIVKEHIEEKVSINDKLDQLIEAMQQTVVPQKKVKEKRERFTELPFNLRSKVKTAAMKNKTLVFILKSNNVIVPKLCDIGDGMVHIDGKYYNASQDFFYMYRGKIPALVIKEWDINPVGTPDYYEAVKEKRIIDPQTIMIRAFKAAQTNMNNPFGGKTWIWIGLGIIVVAYVLFGGG